MTVTELIKNDLVKYFVDYSIKDAEVGIKDLCDTLSPNICRMNSLTSDVPNAVKAWTALQILQNSNRRIYFDTNRMFVYNTERSIILYHGTDNPNIIPSIEFPNDWCDFGRGFYLGPNKDIAEEWACYRTEESEYDAIPYVQTYLLDLDDLIVFDFEQYSTEAYISEILKHNAINAIGIDTVSKERYISNNSTNVKSFDVIKGWRMDSTYNVILQNAVALNYSKKQLSEAIHLGKLGEQYCVKSVKAFKKLHRIFSESYEVSDVKSKLNSYSTRIKLANDSLNKMLEVQYD